VRAMPVTDVFALRARALITTEIASVDAGYRPRPTETLERKLSGGTVHGGQVLRSAQGVSRAASA
jgi:hypothetical protein